ncbi:MAG: hypothetical protein LPK12_06510 [Rhodobacterales bacterium]|nr:hypothetical protein [Rhodobacterales bacterium]MDX5499638.1 hypothetical protein [Rhodobacterales bacterium]
MADRPVIGAFRYTHHGFEKCASLSRKDWRFHAKMFSNIEMLLQDAACLITLASHPIRIFPEACA